MKPTKLIFLLLSLLALLPEKTSAQSGIVGQKAVRITVGTVDGFSFLSSDQRRMFHAGIAYTRCNRNRSRWVIGAEYLHKDYRYKRYAIPKAQFTGEAGYYVPLAGDRRKNIVLSLGLSALAGYETSNWGNKRLPDGATLTNEDGMLYGGALSAEVEAALCERLALVVNIRQRALGGSSLGAFHTLFGLGFKFTFN